MGRREWGGWGERDGGGKWGGVGEGLEVLGGMLGMSWGGREGGSWGGWREVKGKFWAEGTDDWGEWGGSEGGVGGRGRG